MTETNKTRRNSILLACGIAFALAVWMLSGLGSNPAPAVDRSAATGRGAAEAGDERRTQVMVRQSTARQITREVSISARTEPNRSVELKAETDGAIVALGAERGSRVASGRTVATLDMRDRESQLAEAEALIVQMRLQYEAALNLRGEQFVSEAQIAEARARLVSAEAARERIRLDIERTSVEAPFDALLQERMVEIGDYVASGDSVAQLVDIDPIIVVGDVNEREVGQLMVGREGVADFRGVGERVGKIRYLAPVADESTRTFRVELAVPNPAHELRAGMTARLRLAAEEITAHSLTPALLALADDGTVGVKTVDAFDRVRFFPVEIVGSSPDGMLVTGLPDNVRVISVGQGYVIEGQAVISAEDPAALSQSRDERPY